MNIETFGANEIENMQESLFKDIELNEAVSPPRFGAIRCGGFSARKPNTKHQS